MNDKTEKKDGIGITAWFTIILALGLALMVAKTFYDRKAEELAAAERAKEQAEQAQREKWAAEAAARAEEMELEREAELKNADPAKLRELVSSCKSAISTKLSEGPLAFSFPYYPPPTLTSLADAAAALGGNTRSQGFLSAALDDYDFDAIKWNLERITGKYPSRSIQFVVEGAQDGFTAKRYAAIYSCRLDGLSITEPKRDKVVFLN